MRKQLKDVLIKITKVFNDENIEWAVGASLVLNHHGLVDTVNDIDILIATNDIHKAEKQLLSMGIKQETAQISTYSNAYFACFIIDGVEIDLISGMVINNHECSYLYPFDRASIVGTKTINNLELPLSSLEEWYILYQMIPGREKKVAILDTHFEKEGIINRHLLQRSLGADLPECIKIKVKKLLDK